MDDSNLQSLHLDTNSLLTPTREASRTICLSPLLFYPTQKAHALIHTLHAFYLPLPLPPLITCLTFAFVLDEFSINAKNIYYSKCFL